MCLEYGVWGRVGKERGSRYENMGLEYTGKTTVRSVFWGDWHWDGEQLFPNSWLWLRQGSTRKC